MTITELNIYILLVFNINKYHFNPGAMSTNYAYDVFCSFVAIIIVLLCY